MRRTRNTIATGVALLIGALALNPATATVRDSYRPAEKPVNCFQKWPAMRYLTRDFIPPVTRASELDQMVALCRWPDDHSATQNRSITPDLTF
jgi:hypothetical protein